MNGTIHFSFSSGLHQPVQLFISGEDTIFRWIVNIKFDLPGLDVHRNKEFKDQQCHSVYLLLRVQLWHSKQKEVHCLSEPI